MQDYLVISYFTYNSIYEAEIENLKKSLIDLDIDHYIKGIDCLGSWEKNTHYKASFVLDCLDKFQRPVVFIDADAIVRDNLNLFNKADFDVGIRFQDFSYRLQEPLSGTLYFKYSPQVIELIKCWIKINNENPSKRSKPDTWEQQNLGKALSGFPDLKVYNLPPEYVYIFDRFRKMYPQTSPVIEHFQASRKLY